MLYGLDLLGFIGKKMDKHDKISIPEYKYVG